MSIEMRYISQYIILDEIFKSTPNSKENCIFSQICNFTFFHLLCELVDETTRADLKRTFEYDLQQMERLLVPINTNDKKLAYKIFQNENYALANETQNFLLQHFKVEMESFDDQNLSTAEKLVESWLKLFTEHRISQIIKVPNINRVTYYAINWEKLFDKASTAKEIFYQNASDSIEVEMMNISGKFKYREDHYWNASFIELNCSNEGNEDISVLICLPNDVSSFDYAMPDHILIEVIGKMEEEQVHVSIPKFRTNSECNIKEIVGQYMGVSRICR